jgi:hypothetical protein
MKPEEQLHAEPKLLISESLQGMLPDDDLAQLDEMFITVAVVVDATSPMIMGNLVGVEFGEVLKIDMKIPIRMAFEFVSMSMKESKKPAMFAALMLADETVKVPGPFNIVNFKIVDVDSSNKLCVVAIDLVKLDA